MTLRTTLVSLAAAGSLTLAAAAQAQLTLRGDYAASRGITEVSALYAKETKSSVVVTPFSTNAGIEGVVKGEIDVAASARPPVASRPAEKDLVFWPVAWDAVVFIVHPSNPVKNLTLAQVRDIYLGKLDNWKDIGGRDAPIDLYSVMGPYDGLEASIRQILFGNPGYMAKIDRLFLNQHQIEVGIQMDPDAIGMTTLAGLSKQKVKALNIEDVVADKDTVADGRYLLTIPLYMVYRADNPKAAEITRFAEFLRTPIAETVIVNKRLVPHREDQDFKEMHAQRLATLWAKLGGQPAPPGAVRFVSDDATVADAQNGAAPVDAEGAVAPAAVAASTTQATGADATDATAKATPAASTPQATATIASSKPASATPATVSAANAAPDAANGDTDKPDCKKTPSNPKC